MALVDRRNPIALAKKRFASSLLRTNVSPTPAKATMIASLAIPSQRPPIADHRTVGLAVAIRARQIAGYRRLCGRAATFDRRFPNDVLPQSSVQKEHQQRLNVWPLPGTPLAVSNGSKVGVSRRPARICCANGTWPTPQESRLGWLVEVFA